MYAARPFAAWFPDSGDRVLRVTVGARCDRLRLMFFGNLHQDWTEFVLTDLGVFQYESVPLALAAYARSGWPGSRHRRMRVLERCGRDGDALALALDAAFGGGILDRDAVRAVARA